MTKKSFWDNSSLQEDIKWDNQELPGCPDEVLLTKNWNRVEGNRQAAVTRESNEEYRRRRSEGIKKNNQDPEYRKRYLEGENNKRNNPNFWQAYYKGIKQRDQDPEYHKRRIAASNAKLSIKISTPEGEFSSISEAARHYKMTSEGMRHRVNSDKYPDFKKIQK